MSWLGGWFDPELEELFRNEPELLETARLVRAARPDAEADPRFRNRLRAQLIAESSRGRGAFGIRRRWHLGPTHVAWGGAALGLALIGATVLTFVSKALNVGLRPATTGNRWTSSPSSRPVPAGKYGAQVQ